MQPHELLNALYASEINCRIESFFDDGWIGWLGGLAALRRYHELPQGRSIWRQIQIAGVPEGMFSMEQ